MDGILRVFESPGDTRVLIFMMLIGSMMALIERNGGVGGLIRALSKLRFSQSPKGAQWLAWGTGVVIFIESTVTLLVAGAVARPPVRPLPALPGAAGLSHRQHFRPRVHSHPPKCLGAINLGLLENTGLNDPSAYSSAPSPSTSMPLAPWPLPPPPSPSAGASTHGRRRRPRG